MPSRAVAAIGRRVSLLASSSLMATTLMAGAGGIALTVLTPSQAQAVILCSGGHPGPFDFTCDITGGGPNPVVAAGETDFHFGAATSPVSVTNGAFNHGVAFDPASSITIFGPRDGLTLTNTTGNTTTTTPSGSTIGGTINVDTGKGFVFTSTTG